MTVNSGPIAGIVLAAGRSSRMGTHKALLSIDGLPLIRWQLNALEACCELRIAVAGDHTVAEASGDAQTCLNAQLSAPMLKSVQIGAVAALDGGAAGALVVPVDAPLEGTAVCEALLAHWRETGCDVATPCHNGLPGHPIWLSRKALERLLTLDPALHTLRDVVPAPSEPDRVEVASPSVLLNLNTPNEWARWMEQR